MIQNYAESSGLTYNPFFESENLSTWQDGPNGITYQLLPNPDDWALQWYQNKPESTGPQRTATILGVFPLPIIPAFPLGLLSANINIWYDEQAGGCGGLAPIGYMFVNQTVFPPTTDPTNSGNPDWFTQNSQVYDGNGDVHQNE